MQAKGNAKKRKYFIDIPYIAFLFLIILVLVMTGLTAYYGYSLRAVNQKNEAAMQQLVESFDQLLAYNPGEEEALHIAVTAPAPPDSATTLSEALSVMQAQYDQFTGNITFFFTLFSLLISVFTIGLPIMNYLFFQKDTVRSIKLALRRLEEETDEKITRMEKTIVQMQQITASAASAEAAPESIKPIGESAADKANSLYLKALMAYNKKQYQAALKQLNEAIALHEDGRYFFSRALVYSHLEEHNKAIADSTRAIELDSKDSSAYINRGNSYNNLKKYDEAISDYTCSIKLTPENAIVYYNRGIVYDELEKYDDAIKDYSYAIELDPENIDAYNNRGYIYARLGKLDFAMEDCNKAIMLDPEYAYAYDSRGFVYQQKELYPQALEDFNTAIRLDPNLTDAYLHRSQVYLALNKPDKAWKDYHKARDLDNSSLAAKLDTLYEELTAEVVDLQADIEQPGFPLAEGDE